MLHRFEDVDIAPTDTDHEPLSPAWTPIDTDEYKRWAAYRRGDGYGQEEQELFELLDRYPAADTQIRAYYAKWGRVSKLDVRRRAARAEMIAEIEAQERRAAKYARFQDLLIEELPTTR